MYHIGLQTLRAKIRGFHVTGLKISRRISRSKGARRVRLWGLKRLIGDSCRHHLIAYGLLRGLSYDRIERCSERNRPNPELVLRIVLEHNTWTSNRPFVKYDLAHIKGWLTKPAMETEQLAVRIPRVSINVLSDLPSASQAPTMAQEKGVR